MVSSFRRRAARKRRRIGLRNISHEQLERRDLLASDFTNTSIRLDVSNDGFVSPIDALITINDLNENGSRPLGSSTDPVTEFIDPSGDSFVSPIDVLMVVNALNNDFSPPEISVGLVNDTAANGTNDDLVTADSTLAGLVTDEIGTKSLRAQFDQSEFFDVEFDLDGNFIIDPNSTPPLTDGVHTLRLVAADARGLESTPLEFSFELDTTSPLATLDLAQTFDSGVVGDRLTSQSIVRLELRSEPGAQARIDSLGVFGETGSDGLLTVDDVALSDGINEFEVIATDLAGNQTVSVQRIVQVNSDQAFALVEADSFATEVDVDVNTGADATDRRRLRIGLSALFDTSDQAATVADLLNVFVVDANDPTRTLLDKGTPGTPVFSSEEGETSLAPGIASLQGDDLLLDLSTIAGSEAKLRFQLLSGDDDRNSLVIVDQLTSEPATNALPGLNLPAIQPLTPSSASLDQNELSRAPEIETEILQATFSSETGTFEITMQLVNRGAAVGKTLALFIGKLPSGVSVSEATVDANGNSMLNVSNTVGPGGLRPGQSTKPFTVAIDNPSNIRFPFELQVHSGEPNRAPELLPVDTIEVMPGDVIERSVVASDPDEDSVTLSIVPIPGQPPLPTMELKADGTLVVSPQADQLGAVEFELRASDGAATASQTVQVNVVSDPIGTTRVSGKVLDTNLNPIPGITINIGSTSTLTDEGGNFLLEAPAAGFDDNAVKIHGEEHVGDDVFPFIAEKLILVLPNGRTELIEGVNNVLPRPIYLPALDVAGGTTIDPAADTSVEQEIAPGEMVKLDVAAGTLLDQQGNPFTGTLGITEVPPDLTPAALPRDVFPDVVVTVQPGEMVFTEQAPITFPNRGGFPPGERLDLLSVNHITGLFDVVGELQVSADGRVIETISGGIRNSSWHLGARRAASADRTEKAGDAEKNAHNQAEKCNVNCEALAERLTGRKNILPGGANATVQATTIGGIDLQKGANSAQSSGAPVRSPGKIFSLGPPSGGSVATSDVELHSGTLNEIHELVTYQSLGTERGPILRYDSGRADPRPIVHFDMQNAIGNTTGGVDRFLVATATVSRGGLVRQVPGADTGVLGLAGGEHFWRLPDGINDIDAAIQVDMTDQPTGVYNVNLLFGTRLFNGGRFVGTASESTVPVVVVNSVESPFGAGWDLVGFQQLIEQPDGSVLLVDGDGVQTSFAPPAIDGQPFQSPIGDFTTMERLVDGTFRRTTKDQTVFQFNVANALETVTDRNGNRITYTFDDSGRLTGFIDPVGLQTVFAYTGNRISEITDPANRVTSFEYDAAGNLIQITDPDGTSRQFEYDELHHLTAELNKRGFRESVDYGFHGRVTSVTRKDGSQSQFDAVQVQGLFPSDLTANHNTAPLARIVGSSARANFTDPNGNLTSTELDQGGQIKRQQDALGLLPSHVRDPNSNQVLTATDPLGQSTFFRYDDRGNVASTRKEFLEKSGTLLAGVAHDLGFAPSHVATSDLDGDGDIDAVVSLLQDSSGVLPVLVNRVIVFENVDGQLVEHSLIGAGGFGARRVVLDDLNGDDIPDLAVTSLSDGGRFSVKFGNGDLTFGSSNRVVLDDNPLGFDTGDLNGDGFTDVIVSASDGPQAKVLFGDGSGEFTITTIRIGSVSTDVAIADFNRDGSLDAVFTTANNVKLSFGDGQGTFTEPNRISNVNGERYDSVASADLNNDGIIDFATTRGSAVDAFINNGDGTFNQESFLRTGADLSQTITLRDMNFDGATDIVVPGDQQDGVFIFLNDGFGNFDTNFDFEGGVGATAVAVDDLDGDGDFDGLAVSRLGEQMIVLPGIADGTFVSQRIRFGQGNEATPLQIADVTGDGRPDLLSMDADGLTVRPGDALGEFGSNLQFPLLSAATDLAVDDLNADGLTDVVAIGAFQIGIVLGLADETFSEPKLIDIPANGASVEIADVTGDGHADVVAQTRFDTTNSSILVLPGNGNGTFGAEIRFDVESIARNLDDVLQLVDVDGDGNRDILFVNSFGAFGILASDGQGGFAEQRNVGGLGAQLGFVHAQDLNNDGFNDLIGISRIATGGLKNAALVRLSDTAGGFEPVTAFPIGRSSRGLEVVDFDGDGNHDILTTNQQDNTLSVLIGNGDGTLQSVQNFVTTSRAQGLALGDIDLDGDLDVAVSGVVRLSGNVRGTTYTVLRNETLHGCPTERCVATFEYDPSFSQPTLVTDELGRQTALEIDPATGNTLLVRRIFGQADDASDENDDIVTRFSYTDAGLIETETDPLGRVTSYEYDQFGRTTTVTFAVGTPGEAQRVFEYDTAGNLIAEVDENVRRTEYTYDSLDRVTSIRDPLGNETLFSYDENGNLLTQTDVLGNATEFEYDELDRIVATTDALGGREQLFYDRFNNLVRTIDRLGRQTNFVYDARNRLIETIDPAGSSTSLVYDANNNVTRTTDKNGNATHMIFDGGVRPRAMLDAAGGMTRTSFDPLNNPTVIIDELGRRTEMVYDEANRAVVTRLPDQDGNGPLPAPELRLAYDGVGNLIEEIDPLGNVTQRIFDNRDRLVREIQPDPDGDGPLESPVAEFAYDATFNLTSATDPLGRTTLFEFDDLDRLIRESRPDPDGAGPESSPVFTSTYDAFGNLIASTDALGNTTFYEYDALHRRTRETKPDPDADGPLLSPVTNFAYDAADQLIEISDPLNRATNLEYDLQGRLVRRTDPDPDGPGGDPAPVLTFEYDSFGNTTATVDALGNRTSYLFDSLHRLVQETQPDPDSDGPLTNPVTTFTYDAANQIIATSDPLNRTTRYRYDGLGLLSRVEDPDPDDDGPLEEAITTFAYDLFGNRVSMTDALGNVTRYDYDNLHRLLNTISPDPDGDGPLTSPILSNRYDAAGQQIASIDPLGRTTTYQYDGLGRIVVRTDPQADGPGTAPVTTFTFDLMNNLIATTDALGNVTRSTYDNLYREISRIEADPDGDGLLLSPVTSFTYDAVDQLLSISDPLGRTTSFEYDDLGRVSRLTDPDPDGLGAGSAPQTVFEYDLVGNPLATIDPLGNRTQSVFDNLHRQVMQVDADPDGDGPLASPITAFQYDTANQLLAIIDPLGRTTQFTYDGRGRTTTITEPDPDREGPEPSPVTTFEYDQVDNLLAVIDPLGNVSRTEYDNLYRVLREIEADPDGDGVSPSPITTFDYDAAGQLLTVTDPLNRVTLFTYDGLGRTIQVTEPDPDGAGPLLRPETRFEFDLVGNQTALVDALGNTTQFEYDSLYREISRTAPDPDGLGPQTNPITRFQYDVASQLTSITDPLGRTASFDYDGLGRNVRTTLPDPDGDGPLSSPIELTVYDLVDNPISVVDSLGNATQSVYDNLYRPVQRIFADPDDAGPLASPVTTLSYDVASQLISISDPLGRTTTYLYDDLGRRVLTTRPDPDGVGPETSPLIRSTYDLVGNLLSQTDALDHSTTFGYDSLYRRTSLTDANGEVTRFAFDLVGNQVSLTDAVGNTTTWDYDGLDRNIRETNELGASRVYSYDAEDNLIEMTDRNGRVIQSDFDNMYRKVEERWLEADNVVRTMNFAFDVAGQLLTAGDPTGAYVYAYDDLGRVTRAEHDIFGLTPLVISRNSYDSEDNLTRRAIELGGTADCVNNYTYDNLFRMTQLVQTGVEGGNSVAPKQIDVSYDAASQPQTLRRFADIGSTQLVALTQYGFDSAGRLTELSHSKGSNLLADYDWVFDAGNRVTQFTSSQDGVANYEHDARNQLLTSDFDFQADEQFQYDANGNRTGSNIVNGANNRLLSDGQFSYAYDAEGNRTRRVDLASGAITEYEWDHRNRLIQVTERESEAGAATKTVNHEYDVFNRWVVSFGDSDGDGPVAAFERYFVYEGNQIVMEFSGSEANDLSNRYLWGSRVDQLLADEQVSSLDTAGEVMWALTDNIGTVRDLAKYDPGSDTTTVVNHRTYNSFGNLTSETDSAIESLFGFTGRPFDAETGLQNNLNRWYEPATGRWISEDPIGFAGGDANLNRYVGNQVLVLTDPDGLRQLDLGFVEAEARIAEEERIAREQQDKQQFVRDLAALPLSFLDQSTREALTIKSVEVAEGLNQLLQDAKELLPTPDNMTKRQFATAMSMIAMLQGDPETAAKIDKQFGFGKQGEIAKNVLVGIAQMPKAMYDRFLRNIAAYHELIRVNCAQQADRVLKLIALDAAEAGLIIQQTASGGLRVKSKAKEKGSALENRRIEKRSERAKKEIEKFREKKNNLENQKEFDRIVKSFRESTDHTVTRAAHNIAARKKTNPQTGKKFKNQQELFEQQLKDTPNVNPKAKKIQEMIDSGEAVNRADAIHKLGLKDPLGKELQLPDGTKKTTQGQLNNLKEVDNVHKPKDVKKEAELFEKGGEKKPAKKQQEALADSFFGTFDAEVGGNAVAGGLPGAVR